MAVHSQQLPIAIPVSDSSVAGDSSPLSKSISAKRPKKPKRTSYTSVSQSSLQRLQQYNAHPLSDEYVPGLFADFEDADPSGTQSSLENYYSDDESDDSLSSSSGSFSASSSMFVIPSKSYEFSTSKPSTGIIGSVSLSGSSFGTIATIGSIGSISSNQNPHELCISSPHTSVNATHVTSHEFSSKSSSQLISRSPSTDSLITLLNDRKRKTFVSNLSSSFKNWKDTLQKSSQNWFPYSSLSPRMTDDQVPKHSPSHTPTHTPTTTLLSAPESQELTTFRAEQNLQDDIIPTRKSFKNRDQRINCEFLRLYAADFHARTVSRTLPNTNHDSSYQDNSELVRMVDSKPSLKHFHYSHNIYRISTMSRDKLWSSIILPPRSDESPTVGVDCSNYVYIGSEDSECTSFSVIRPSGKNYMPWETGTVSTKTTFTPAGVDTHGTRKLNGLAPSSGVTMSQFTVKGWTNPRWIAQHP